jgi:tetratricopeptide (TPR) repeat protein
MRFLKYIVLITLIAGVAVTRANAQSKIEKARQAIKNEQYKSALSSLSKIQTAKSQYYTGKVYIHLLKTDSAKAAFKKGIKMADKFPLNYVGLARISFLNKDSVKAEDYIKKALHEMPTHHRHAKNPATYTEIMNVYGSAGFYNKAIKYGNKALQVKQSKKTKAYLLVALGDVYVKKNMHNLSRPVSYYNRAIRLDPSNAEAYTRLAVAWSRARKPQKAKNYFAKAIKANSNYGPAYREKAIFYYRRYREKPDSRQDKLQKAISVYKKYLPIVGNTCQAGTRYVQFVFLEGEAKTALQEIDKLKQNSKCDELLQMGHMEGYSAFVTGNYKQAGQALKGFTKKAPKAMIIPADYVYLGKAQLKLDSTNHKLDPAKQKEAIQNLYKSLQFADTANKFNYRRLYNNVAKTFFTNGIYLDAAKMYQQKIEKFKPYHGVTTDLRDMGRAYAFAGKYKKADAAFAKLVKKDPTYVFGYFMRAQVNAQKGMPQDSARHFYQKVIELAKNKPDKYGSYLAQAYKFMGNYYYNKGNTNIQDLDSTIAFYQRWYQLDPQKYLQVKKAVTSLKKRKAYIINRRKIIEEHKKAKADSTK